MEKNNEICMRYTDNRGMPTDNYPYNPNGSQFAVAGITNSDGRITAMMPHPERVYRNIQCSWIPGHLAEPSPWQRMFQSARKWLS